MALVILDRDGVINEDSDNFIKSVAEWIPIPGSIDAIARLCQAGHQVVVATNQSGIGRGLFSLETFEEMNHKLNTLVEQAGGQLAGIFFCPHTPDDHCTCRKPAPGMMYQVRDSLGLALEGSWLVGDSLRDLQAAQTSGCQPVLVRTGKGMRTIASGEGLEGIPIYDDLSGFADNLLATSP